MEAYCFREPPDTPVLLCLHLAQGGELYRVYHLPEEECVWQMACRTCGAESNHGEPVRSTLGKVLQQYPDLADLAETPADMAVLFQKGKNSGKWYDFYLG